MSLFATGRANKTTPPGRGPQRHHNEQVHVGAGAGTAGGWRCGIVFGGGFWSVCGVGDIFDLCFFYHRVH
jgi:hypothetical protein